MTDTSSNDIWSAPQRPDIFESRSHRFREEMRPVLYQYLGITPDSLLLDAGCGSGVFTRYLAKGLTTGFATGFDINAGFIEYGIAKAEEAGGSDRMRLHIADGFALPYEDDSFDAVTNYTYIGVLSDPEAGLRELIRVLRPDGVASCVVAASNLPYAFFQGGYPFDGAEELQRLSVLERAIFANFANKPADLYQVSKWDALSYPKLFKACGLRDIRVYPFAHLICYNDASYPLEYRRNLALTETREEIDWLKSRYSGKEGIYAEFGFTPFDYQRLLLLLRRKLDYFSENFEDDCSYEWHGGFNYIVAGRK